MKFKNILLTMLLLLAVLSLGAVSAADGNATSEDIAVENDVEDALEVLDASDETIGDAGQSGELFNVSVPDDIRECISFEINFTGASDLNGELEVGVGDIDDDWADVVNGSATATLTLNAGVHEVKYVYWEEYYDDNLEDYVESYRYQSSFKVTVKDLFNVTMPEYKLDKFKLVFTAPSYINGKLEVDWIEDFAYVDVKNGKASVILNTIPGELEYRFENDDIYLSKSIPSEDLHPFYIEAGNFKTLYTSKKQYKVRIVDSHSKPVAGKTVTFELKGYDYRTGKNVKKTKTAKTDEKGYAKVRFDLTSGAYDVKIKCLNAESITYDYVINSLIKPKQIYKKHSRIKSVTAKKFEFGASLKKVDGKILKGKKVKITFYRQNYKGKINHYYWGRLSVLKTLTLKTNSKGVVKKTYTKLPFKVTRDELEGVTILVKISYGKDEEWVNFNVYSLSPIKYYFM